jgi:ceramide glucosyltransferase
MDALFIIGLILTGIGLLQAVLMLLHAWEHRRFHRRRKSSPLPTQHSLRVSLIAPCKGLDADLRTNLEALFIQNYSLYELCFVTEAADDPAVAVIHEVAATFPQINCRLITAGVADDCGQKVHNLIQATRAVLATPHPPDVLAFVDSDACPHRDWLGRLVHRLENGKHSVATGYRWYLPIHNGWANRLLSAVNNTVIAALGPHGFNLVWGGAWAIRRECFESLGLPAAWHGTLSDDLVVSQLVHRARLRVGYEPHCLVRSIADFDAGRVAEFLRRQFVVARVYAPNWWRLAFCGGLITNLSSWGLLIVAAVALARNALPTLAVALGGWTAVWLLGAARFAWGAAAVRPFVPVDDASYRNVARINIWLWPIVALVSWGGTVASLWGRVIVWRGIRYRLDSSQSTSILNHPAQPAVPEQPSLKGSHARSTTRAA